jgi:nicotinate-nucleotide pyrophosphorylase (carboxylating)
VTPETLAALRAAGLDAGEVARVVAAALDEDFRYGPDVTSAATVAGRTLTADVVARQAGVLAGVPVALAVLDLAVDGAGVAGIAGVPDGARIAPGDAVLRVSGPATAVLGAERTMLNFLTRLSGIATATRAWADAVAGTGAVIRDTRKTTPGLRAVEKYAVRCGGGENHRMGLGDAALIKDNHVAAAGGVAGAVAAVRSAGRGVPLEVECDSLPQVREALAAGARFLLLDNMDTGGLREAVAAARAYDGVRLEASGGLRLATARDVALTGVDYLAVGALTHSSPALDLGLDVVEPLPNRGCDQLLVVSARGEERRAPPHPGPLAQWERASLTRKRPEVQILYGPPASWPGTPWPTRIFARCGPTPYCMTGTAARARTCRTISSPPGSRRGRGR